LTSFTGRTGSPGVWPLSVYVASPSLRCKLPPFVLVLQNRALGQGSFISGVYYYNPRVIIAAMPWEVEYTDEFGEWFDGLSEEGQEDVALAVEKLEERGPALPRPLADTVEGSRHSNMKELRPLGTNIRVLFAFDPRRMAILLIGGDKTDRWSEFYEEMIPLADDLYDDHLDELREDRRDIVSGRHSFRKLREQIERDPERRERMEEKRKAYDAVLNLAELREARGLTQAELAERLGVSQPNVSKLEAAAASPHAGAIYLSTLGGYIAALGGHLEVRAVFPEHPEDDVAVAVGGGWVENPDAGRRGG
jgi:DNA-binding XRE family transcriptional regulator